MNHFPYTRIDTVQWEKKKSDQHLYASVCSDDVYLPTRAQSSAAIYAVSAVVVGNTLLLSYVHNHHLHTQTNNAVRFCFLVCCKSRDSWRVNPISSPLRAKIRRWIYCYLLFGIIFSIVDGTRCVVPAFQNRRVTGDGNTQTRIWRDGFSAGVLLFLIFIFLFLIKMWCEGLTV